MRRWLRPMTSLRFEIERDDLCDRSGRQVPPYLPIVVARGDICISGICGGLPLRRTVSALYCIGINLRGPSGFSAGERVEMCHDRATASRASRADARRLGAPGPRVALAA